jgi:nitrogenase molybdenum-iron protein alpha/beta subunit
MLGAIIASESLGLTDTLINGAGGCRSRSQIMMHDLIPEYYPENRACSRSKYFSKQSRLPCTYLGNDDVVFGASAKVSDGISSISSITGRKAVILDTLGASLICTDYSGLTGSAGKDPIILDGDLSGMSMPEGYDAVTSAILSSTEIENGESGGINIIGYGLMDLGWQTGATEIRRLLEPMGAKINCILGCVPDKNSIMGCGGADLNVMIHPEYCRRTADMMRSRFGIPSLRPSEGSPIGYPASRAFVREVADALGLDPTPSLELIDRDAEAVHRVLMNYERIPRSLHSEGLSVEGDSSIVYPLTKWMTGLFGMAPKNIVPSDGEYLPEIRSYLGSCGFESALNGSEEGIEAYFTDGLTALEGNISRSTSAYIEISMPRGRSLDLMERTLIGTRGCRYILDSLMNGLRRFRCGQPEEIDYRPGQSV